MSIFTKTENSNDGIIKNISVAIGLEPKNEIEEACDTCGLSRFQRYTCFGVLFVIGGLLNWLSFVSITNPRQFALIYSIGNIISLISGCFLAGFVSQFKNMFKQKRIIITVIYIIALIMTIVSAVKGYPILLVIFFALIQFLALIIYMISYIPYGLTMLKNILFCGKC